MNQGTQQFPQGGTPPSGLQGGPPGGFPGGPRSGGFFLMRYLSGPWMAIFVLVVLLVSAIVFWQIYRKAGRNGLIGLLALVPIVNLGVMLYIAFAEWPVLRELEKLRAFKASVDAGVDTSGPATAPDAIPAVEPAS